MAEPMLKARCGRTEEAATGKEDPWGSRPVRAEFSISVSVQEVTSLSQGLGVVAHCLLPKK